MRSSVEVETNMWSFLFRFTCIVDSVFLSRIMSLSLCQSCFLYCQSSAFTLHSALAVAALRSHHIHYSSSSCLDVHKSGSKLDPKIPHAAPWGLLVPLVAVSIMSHYNTSRTAGSDTGWCTWRDECIPVKGMCQLIVSVSWDARRTAVSSDLTCYEYVLTAGEQQRQCLILDLHGDFVSVRTVGRRGSRCRTGWAHFGRVC